MAEKQRDELRRKLLSRFPKGSKLKHYRSGGYNNMRTFVVVVSPLGNVIREFSGIDLESTIRGAIADVDRNA